MERDDFKKYATKHLGINSMVLDGVIKAQSQYLNPYILEERQLNVTQMDVFSRLMMDRVIFLGTQIDDYTANTLQAQLLYLDSVDSGKDISIYINSPGGSVSAGLGIYDTMQFINSDVVTICTGMAASMASHSVSHSPRALPAGVLRVQTWVLFSKRWRNVHFRAESWASAVS